MWLSLISSRVGFPWTRPSFTMDTKNPFPHWKGWWEIQKHWDSCFLFRITSLQTKRGQNLICFMSLTHWKYYMLHCTYWNLCPMGNEMHGLESWILDMAQILCNMSMGIQEILKNQDTNLYTLSQIYNLW